MATVLITGGTGLIGQALMKELITKGYEVIILTRNIIKEKRSINNLSYAEWNIDKGTIDEKAIKESDYIVHLAGANVGQGRWNRRAYSKSIKGNS
jgi:NAD dependent epimerase/dehydratase family enzyme